MTNIIQSLKKYRWFIKGTCAGVLLSILVSSIDLSAVIPLFAQVNFILVIIFGMYLISLCLGTVRWRLFLPNVPFRQLFITAWIGNFFSNFLPSSIGGDSYRVLSLREQVGFSTVTTSVLLDRISGIVPIVLIGLPTLLWFAPSFLSGPIAFAFLSVAGGVCFLVYLCTRDSAWFQLNISRVTIALKGMRRPFLFASIISFGYLGVGALSMWLYYSMFGHELSFGTVVGLYAVLQLVELLPISINSLGVREGTLVVLFSMVGVPAEASLGIAILSRLVLLVQTAVGGLLYALKDNLVSK